MALLSISGLQAGYETGQVLFDVDLEVEEQEVVALLGRNGAGKTTTMNAVMGADVPNVLGGSIEFDGTELIGRPSHEISRFGVSLVPEARRTFRELTVTENLRLAHNHASDPLSVDEVLERFPELREMRDRPAKNMSGGEQQMLAIGRALRGKTELLLLDEPTEGLAPQIVEDVIDAIERIQEQDIPILVVEQNLNTIFEVADRVFILEQGRNVYEGTVAELRDDTETQQQYLGVGTNPDVEAFD